MKPPADNTWQITAMLNAMSYAQLTALIAEAEAARADKLSEAKQELIDRFRAEAEALGLSVDGLLDQPAPEAVRDGLPPNWHRRVIAYLKAHEGYAPIGKLHRAVWSGGGGKGLGKKLRTALRDLVDQGELVLIRDGGPNGHAIFGLASMVEAEVEVETEIAA